MNILKSIAVLSLSVTMLLATAPHKKEKKHSEFKQIVKIGNKSSKKLLKTLGKNMKANMKKGGVMGALDFCSNEAYSLTQKVNSSLPKNVKVKRISAKYRSGANKPDANEAKILKSLENLNSLHVVLPKHLVQKINKHTYKYYRPLVIKKPVCLKCHGDISKNHELQKAIQSRYPNDKATGYKMGDLRGVVVVTIKK